MSNTSTDGPNSSQELPNRGSRPPEAGEATSRPLHHQTVSAATPLEVVNIAIRRWRLVFGLPIALALFSLLISYIVSPTYRATTTFTPEGRPAVKAPTS
jgi:hypothetical protein